jgi:hypothetical protein
MSQAELPEMRLPLPARLAALAAAGLLAAMGVAYYLTYEPAPQIHVLWRDDLDPDRRAELERRFRLVHPAPFEDRLTYDLLDTSERNIRAMMTEPDLDDTDRVDQSRYLIPFDVPYGGSWMWIAHRIPLLRAPGIVTGLVLTCVIVLAACGGAWAEGRRLRRLIRKDVAADA